MPTSKKLIYLSAVVIWIVLITGCAAVEQPQVKTAAVTPSAGAKVPPSPTTGTLVQSPSPNSPTACDNAQTQAQINRCAGATASAADAKLNQVYRQLRARLKGSSQEQRLINAQQKWLGFRDADCKYAENQYEGGSFAPAARAFCLAHLTEQRTKDLEDYLESVDR